jgi:hypothetical protein
MTSLYPRERVEAVLQQFTAQWTVSRIMLKTLVAEPLNIFPPPSRFCNGRTFRVVYAAMDLVISLPRSSSAIDSSRVRPASFSVTTIAHVRGLKSAEATSAVFGTTFSSHERLAHNLGELP